MQFVLRKDLPNVPAGTQIDVFLGDIYANCPAGVSYEVVQLLKALVADKNSKLSKKWLKYTGQ